MAWVGLNDVYGLTRMGEDKDAVGHGMDIISHPWGVQNLRFVRKT